MRVLLLGPYPPPHGGVQTNLVAIRDLLRERGHSCAVVNLHRHRTGRGEEVYHPESALQTLALVARLRCDIVHLHLGGDVTPRLLGLAMLCTLKPGAAAVLTFHSGGYASSPAGRTARPRTMRGFVFRRFRRIIAVNQEIAELFKRFGVEADRIRLIAPHPLPSRPQTEMPADLRDFFGAHSPVLVTVGLLEPEYDLPIQLEAFSDVRRQLPRAGLAIIGSGSLEQDLRARIAAHEDSTHILLTGDMPHLATLRAIAEADLFLRTTLYDGDSVAVREALHLGTPVIATNNRMRPEGVTLTPAHDRAALAAAIADRVALSRAPRNGVRGDTANVESVLALYNELLRA